jgi:hypothetical protein
MLVFNNMLIALLPAACMATQGGCKVVAGESEDYRGEERIEE